MSRYGYVSLAEANQTKLCLNQEKKKQQELEEQNPDVSYHISEATQFQENGLNGHKVHISR